MTQTAGVRLGSARPSDYRVIAGVSAAHCISHYYMLLLPPLFVFVRAEFGVSYVELGLALSLFNIFSAALQTPAGFLVDKISAQAVLIGGLLLGTVAFFIAGLSSSYWMLVAMFAIAGIGNAVYHPADYSILSHQVAPERMGQAFSIHTFAGMLGSAAAPASLILLQGYVGWRGAFLVAAAFGLVVAGVLAVLLLSPGTEPAAARPAEKPLPSAATAAPTAGWQLLLSGPIMRNLLFFILFSMVSLGIQSYAVVALAALHDTSLKVGNTALSGYLLLSAGGVLFGGYLVGQTARHGSVATIGMLVTGLVAVIVALVDLGPVLLIIAFSAGGFFLGLIMPSRDMIVREVTPPGSFGKVFGFVTTGFNIGGVIVPLAFGAMMDHGSPAAVFLVIALCCLLSILTLVSSRRAT